MITIYGSTGEGGGQILRTALALSIVTGTPFRIDRIRARRRRPGLMRQHLTAVEAARAVSGAQVDGASIGSSSLYFRPGAAAPGDHHFAVGTAGSATLVLQTVLPALLSAPAPSRLVLEGGTHNPMAPPFDFLRLAFLPLLGRMGARVEARLERPGFYPAGGGRIVVRVEPCALAPLELLERGAPVSRRARALVASLPSSIARRELDVVAQRLAWHDRDLRIETVTDSLGPGNLLSLEVAHEQVTEVFTGFGERGVPAEQVAARACDEAAAYLASDAPVGKHLADQLLLPLALAGGGAFRTVPLDGHTTTQLELIPRFLPTDMTAREEAPGGAWAVEVRRRG
jgi:RNA 3'-terminal phosphate cyclase (ATP)